MLGEREPGIYGAGTLAELDASMRTLADDLGVAVTIRQANSEADIITWVQEPRPGQMSAQDGLILNPGGYTHTSVAIHDALRAVSIPVVEVHLSNLYRRESFRHESVTGVACAGIIMGRGHASYLLALRYPGERLAAK